MHFIRGKRISLRPLLEEDITERYVQWLNDPDVNKYSRRRFFPTSEFDLRSEIMNKRPGEHILLITTKAEDRHVGNIKFSPIDWPNRTTEISILIGSQKDWGKGHATEAIYVLSKHLFHELGLNRIGAGSCNPSFIRVMNKLGWSLEGKLRERFFLDGNFVEYCQFSILKKEFVYRPEYDLDLH